MPSCNAFEKLPISVERNHTKTIHWLTFSMDSHLRHSSLNSVTPSDECHTMRENIPMTREKYIFRENVIKEVAMGAFLI